MIARDRRLESRERVAGEMRIRPAFGLVAIGSARVRALRD
jgi:hypothetical protein